MIVWRGDWGAGRSGLLNGAGSYAYLPFDCTVGQVAGCLYSFEGPCSGSVVFESDGTAIGDPLSLFAGGTVLGAPVPDDEVLPGVTVSNLDDVAKLSLNLSLVGATNVKARYGIELIPVDPAFATAEVWTLFATGESMWHPSLFQGALTGGGPNWSLGDPGYANGYMVFAQGSPVFNTFASKEEQAESLAPGAFHTGAATPMARGGTFSNLTLISSEAGGFDGSYTFSLRRNGHDTLTVSAASGGTRLYADTDSVHFDAGDFFDFQAVASSGTRVLGHLLVTFVADGGGPRGMGFGHQGFGGSGLGG
jgi:hypothetical protein